MGYCDIQTPTPAAIFFLHTLQVGLEAFCLMYCPAASYHPDLHLLSPTNLLREAWSGTLKCCCWLWWVLVPWGREWVTKEWELFSQSASLQTASVYPQLAGINKLFFQRVLD